MGSLYVYYASRKFWRILIWWLYYRPSNCQIFQLYGNIISSSEHTISRWHLRESQEEAAIGNGDLREKIEHKDCEGTPVVHCTKQPIHIVDAPQPEFHEEVPTINQEGAMVSCSTKKSLEADWCVRCTISITIIMVILFSS